MVRLISGNTALGKVGSQAKPEVAEIGPDIPNMKRSAAKRPTAEIADHFIAAGAFPIAKTSNALARPLVLIGHFPLAFASAATVSFFASYRSSARNFNRF